MSISMLMKLCVKQTDNFDGLLRNELKVQLSVYRYIDPVPNYANNNIVLSSVREKWHAKGYFMTYFGNFFYLIFLL